MKRILVLALVLLFPATPSLASEAAFEQHLAKGVRAVDSGDPRGGAAEFREALKERPDDPVATLYLGIALSRAGDGDAEPTLRRAAAMSPRDPRASLEIGIHSWSTGRAADADAWFAKTIELAPGSEFAAKAEAYRRTAGGKAGEEPAGKGVEKRWLLGVSAGGQYDTNVVLGPKDSPLPAAIPRKSDSSLVLCLKGRYGLAAGRDYDVSAGYGFYRNFHRDLRDFDVSQHLLDLRAGYGVAQWLALRGTYAFEYVSLGGDTYDRAHALSASGTVSEGEGRATVVEYRFRKTAFRNAGLFPANSDRTGTNHAVAATQNVAVFRGVRARAGYGYDSDSANAAFWDYKGHKAFVGARAELPLGVAIDLSGEWYRKAYGAPYPGTGGTTRRENTHTYSAQAGVALADRFGAALAYTFIDNFANIGLFTYKREITSLLLNARF